LCDEEEEVLLFDLTKEKEVDVWDDHLELNRHRLDTGEVRSVGTELLAEFRSALTAEIFQKGYRHGDVLWEGDGALGFQRGS